MQWRSSFPCLPVHLWCWRYWNWESVSLCWSWQNLPLWSIWSLCWSHWRISQYYLRGWRRNEVSSLSSRASLSCLPSIPSFQSLLVRDFHLSSLWRRTWRCQSCSSSCWIRNRRWHGLLDCEELLVRRLGRTRLLQDSKRSQYVWNCSMQLLSQGCLRCERHSFIKLFSMRCKPPQI